MRNYPRDYYAIGPEVSESYGVYRILRDMNEDIRELKDSQYETDRRLTHLESTTEELQKDVAVLKQDVAVLKQDIAVLKSDVSGLKNDMKEVRHDIKEIRQDMKDLHGEVREIAGSLSGMQTRLNWWLVIAGVVIATLQYFRP